MATEGNLQAPTRHAIDWKNPGFYNEEAALAEMERIFDICHGCRRCVSLCGSFPTLFDLIDEGQSGEMDGVAKNDYWKVVDQCYLCDLCYMTKCPYVPPHPWNLDFPHTMLRAKAIKFSKGEVGVGEKLLAATDVHGQLAGIPIVVQVANAVNQTRAARGLMEKTLGVDKDAWLPALATRKFRSRTPVSKDYPVRDGEKTPGKVAIYATCYINYNEPGIGHDLLKILDHNEVPYVLVEKENCCGMPKLELGDLEGVDAHKQVNIPVLAKYAKEGYAILAAVPSCALMFKQELPLMYPDEADVQLVKEHMWDPFEYLMARKRDGLLKTEFSTPLGKISYQIPCHGRVQNIGKKTEEMLKMVPGTSVQTHERCSGHAGTFGV
ncbi:MAG: Fe-S oxidoreductase, partial [Burkholderiaceae bacterium]